MADSNEPDLPDGLATRAFELLRKLSKDGKLSAVEVHESVEIFMSISGRNIEAKFDSKFNLLLWAIGIGTALIVASNFIA
ncbi:MAG: hypothetical protein OXI05_03970 [Bacteroidota bacterium]|nr:hypothetical protein [Bacteroidota bacterium]MXW13630.1 hypothetical protein [Rhodothermaceae bacterium]MDE2644983.1 hypothetical protein [Bacteroidota bacterium]MXW33101.1 hypothetical protein [Rhodothermaceae bacterium]MXZ17928.1 hypothetical protein [Rhodothermaceae bacterium]